MSKPQRDRVYPIGSSGARSYWGCPLMNVGPYCRICGIEVQKDRGGPLPQGIIDDITNRWRPLRFAEPPVALQAVQYDQKTIRPKDPDNRRTMTTSEQTNERNERRFRGLIFTYLADRAGECERSEMEDYGAEMCDASPVSTHRYLNKLCSTAGPMQCIDGMVKWRTDKEIEAWLAREDPE